MSLRNMIAKDLRTPKYRPRVVPDKRREMLDGLTEAEILDAAGRGDITPEEFAAWNEEGEE